ncbi:MAG: hypothetical protein JWN44_4538 [Myxococcales bacterium]|nr:hypothetical protein [Myxococcales bacterium]
MTENQQAIESVVQAFVGALNAKDAAALAALFTDDAEFVTIFGTRMRGRAEIESGHARVLSGALAGTRAFAGPMESKLLAPNVALCHARWTRERLPDAAEGSLPPGAGIFTIVLVHEATRWAVAALTNVQDAPPPPLKK